MKIKCPECGRTQEVEEVTWKITQEGFPSGIPGIILPAHPFTCICGDHIKMVPA
jgi:hypothetical protein